MAPKRSGEKAHLSVGSSMPRFKIEFLSDLMARFDDLSAAQIAKQAGLEPYQFSRIVNGKVPFKAKDLVQIGGAFDCDIREAISDPIEHGGNDDAQAIIKDVQQILKTKLKIEWQEQIDHDRNHTEFSTDPDGWENDERWVRARRCLEIIDANESEADERAFEHHLLKQNCQVSITEMRRAVENRLSPLEALQGRDVFFVKKRNEVETSLSKLERLGIEQSKMPFVYVRSKINSSDLRMLREDLKKVLYDWGDEATRQVAMQEQMEGADDQGAFSDVKAAVYPDLAKDRVIPAPPPPAHAAQANIKDLRVCGEAKAGRDGFHLPAGAEAMSYISRPYFLADVGSAYAVYANGESMVPRYDHGELLFVNPSRPPRSGDYCVIQIVADGEISGYVKRFKSANDEITVVQQFNPPMDIEFRTSDVKSVHLIVGSLAAGALAMRAESIRSQLEFVRINGQTAHFVPRFPMYDFAAFQDYFSQIFNEHIDVSNWKITEVITHLNSLLTNTKYLKRSLAKFCAARR